MEYQSVAVVFLALCWRSYRYDHGEYFSQLVFLLAAIVAAWIGWYGFNVEQVVKFVFPVLSGLSLIVSLIMLYRHMFLMRSREVQLSALYMLLNFLAILFLTLIAGDTEEPVVSIEFLRTAIGIAWYVTVVLLIISFKYQVDVCLSIFGSLKSAQK